MGMIGGKKYLDNIKIKKEMCIKNSFNTIFSDNVVYIKNEIKRRIYGIEEENNN
jgi:hypothetical protein